MTVTLSKIKSFFKLAVQDPDEAQHQLKKYLHERGENINARFYRLIRRPGVLVMEEDWDNLIILDGCRYDTFENRNTLDGDLQVRQSRGSSSFEFIQENFQYGNHHDTVYVTANPHVEYVESGTFHDVINLMTEWDEEVETVPPETVADQALQAQKAYPNKRLIIHFMQPHYPFLGEKGRNIDHRGHNKSMKNPTLEGGNIWTQLKLGVSNNSVAEVKEAYIENLDIVLDVVDNLHPQLTGKTVVTADHGNLIGDIERPIPIRGYGHPEGLHIDELVRVPWLVIDADERPNIRPDTPEEQTELDDDMIKSRLQSLGYYE